MIRALLCATHDRTSDRETSRRSRADADWKAAMGADDDFGGIGATTFALMPARMVAHDGDAMLFEATLAKAVTAGIFKGPLTTIIDSPPMHGAGQRGRHPMSWSDEDLRSETAGLAATKPDIDWQDPAVRKAYLVDLVELAEELLLAAGQSEVARRPCGGPGHRSVGPSRRPRRDIRR